MPTIKEKLDNLPNTAPEFAGGNGLMNPEYASWQEDNQAFIKTVDVTAYHHAMKASRQVNSDLYKAEQELAKLQEKVDALRYDLKVARRTEEVLGSIHVD